jgi:hypothetical protein
MAQDRALTARQYCGEATPLEDEARMSDRIDTAVDPVQAPDLDSVL